MAEVPIEGLSETRFGLRYYIPEIHTLIEVVDLRRRSGELWGEMTVRCNLEGVRVQLDGNRMRQGNFNFSSVVTRNSWAKALASVTPESLNATMDWGNILERVCQAVLDHERGGAIHGHEITGKRMGNGGRPWAAWPILPDREMATLFARGGAGKTTLVAQIAFGMALGRSLIPGIRIDRPYRTVILDWETNVETAEDLWGLIAETHHIAVPRGVWYEPMDAPLERSLPKISNILDRHNADLVIVDSVMMSMISAAEGHGDPADSITRVYQSLRRIGTWGLLIDHIAGGDYRSQRAATKAYGSIFKINLARHAVALHIGKRDGDEAEAFILCPKSSVGRDHWAMSGRAVRSDTETRWEFGEPDYELFETLVSDRSSDEGSMNEPSEVDSPTQTYSILVALDRNPTGLTVYQIAKEVDSRSEQTIRTALARFLKRGLVEQLSIEGVRTREKRWVLSQRGVELVESRDLELIRKMSDNLEPTSEQ